MNRTRLRQLARWLPWLMLAIAVALVCAQVQRPAVLLRVWVPWTETGLLALIMTGIILTGGIDLSVGSMVAVCAVVLGVLWRDYDLPISLAVVGALSAGVACGAINGALVVGGISPLVATLATMALYSGAAMAISGADRVTGFPDEFQSWSRFAGVPTQYWLLALLSLVAYVVIHHTRFGSYCFAMGDNPQAAVFAAVPSRRVLWSLYVASGLVAAAVAVLYTVYRDAATPDAHRGVELRVIACVVVGGTSITGGRGGIPQTLLGLAILANLDVGLEFLGARVDYLTAESRLVVIGILLICLAIWNERLSQARL